MPRFRYLVPLALAGLHLACSDGSGPTIPPPLGSFDATIFILADVGQHPVDYLAGGSTLSLRIAEDSTVTGRLFIPAELTGDDPFEADMAGKAVVTDSTVQFDQEADTFIRDLTFARHKGYLEAEQPLNPGSLFHVRLDQFAR